jgi:hypothetical protein
MFRYMLLILALLAICSASAQAGDAEDAVNTAFCGSSQARFLEFFGHEFHVDPMDCSVNGSRVSCQGRISHHLSHRPDDQVYYSIDARSGDHEPRVRININRGGWAGLAGRVVSAAVAIYTGGATIDPGSATEIFRSIGRVQDGSWEGAAETLIGTISITQQSMWNNGGWNCN